MEFYKIGGSFLDGSFIYLVRFGVWNLIFLIFLVK